MKKIIMDACTVILLAKASVLESAAKTFNVILPKSVYEEVLAGKAKKYADALLTNHLVETKIISLMKIENNKLKEQIKWDFGMGDGEAEAITLQLEENFDGVATDNKQGRKAADIYSVPLLGSPDIVMALFKMKKITAEKTKQAFNILKTEGWFNDIFIERLMEEIEHGRN